MRSVEADKRPPHMHDLGGGEQLSEQTRHMDPDPADAENPAAAAPHTDQPRLDDVCREVRTCIHDGESSRLPALVANLHEADIADLIELLGRNDRLAFFAAVKDVIDPDVIPEIEGAALEEVIGTMEPEELAEAVSQMETDDAVAVLEEMDADEQSEVLEKIVGEERAAIEEGLSYPEDSAGRLMQRELVAVPPFWTVGQTLDWLREHENLAEDFYEVFVIDPKYRPIGTMPLSRIMRTKRPVKIEEIMSTGQTLIPVEMDQEEVAFKFGHYNLISAAVTDNIGRLVGVITVDDIVDVIEEEAEEDILALGGVSEGDVNVGVFEVTRTRFGWLLANLVTAIVASIVIGLFGASIEKLVALAVLMPIVASMGGNAGTQTMTVTVRAMATRELTSANIVRIIRREILASLINGVILAIITGVIAAFWFANGPLGAVIATAMIINMLVAGIAGFLIPVGLDRLGIDPAVSSSVFVTTITDVVGFFSFLGLGAMYLM